MFLLNLLRRIERVFLVSTFSLMVVLFFMNVVAREVGGEMASNLSWVEEAVRLMNLFLVFGALGIALERGMHVGIDTFRDRLPAGIRKPLLKVIDLSGLCFCAYLVWQGYVLVKFVLGTGQTSPTLGMRMGWIYLAPVMGFTLLGLRYFLSLIGFIDRFGQNKSEEEAA
ncbi:Tripartite ATP-independent periplasmic transporter DctQ component [Pseudodesulfovibrio mercurii]|uniref:Tripartite ATP-independent periplasmic transporter DctQ component n=1 Tax=Pseudodesulfovibrio mercurii TaxID=641491 RepID=F0JJA1_9BACT|nr:TRAP transporter small permease [Pseudodesulfovibrio mercurii]EGB16000.1 Tripartite ATP-independent periplasmic transporter DctQ component [Pseudodesulfovibrio mercurii]